VAHRLALLELGALSVQRPLLTAEDTRASAVGTGLLLAEGLGLLFEEGLQGSLGESGGGRVGDLLHGAEIDVQAGALVAEDAAGDDLAPASGEVVEFLEFLGGEGARSHDASCLGVGTRTNEQRILSD